MKHLIFLLLFPFCCSLTAQNADAYSFQPGKKGLIALGGYLIEADIQERQRLTYELLPKRSEYQAVFKKEYIRKVQKYHKKWYRSVSPALGPQRATQSYLNCHQTTPEELLEMKGGAKHFPGGYGEIADWFQPGVELYRLQFLEKGARVGTSYDVFVYLDGHWRIFPKPWMANNERTGE